MVTTDEFINIANDYLRCKHFYKSAADWNWVDGPTGKELVWDEAANADALGTAGFYGAIDLLPKKPLAEAVNSAFTPIAKWASDPNKTTKSWFGIPDTTQKVLSSIGNSLSTDSAIIGSLENKNVRDILKQYLFSKAYAEKYPQEYGAVAAKYEESLPKELKPIIQSVITAPQTKALLASMQNISPTLSKGQFYKAIDQLTLDMYNNARPGANKTMKEWSPGADRLDFSRYAPGMAAVGLAPVAIGALTGNLGLGLLGGLGLAGGLGYYGYKRVGDPKWGPSFIDDMLGTADIGQTDSQIKERQERKGPKADGSGGPPPQTSAPPPGVNPPAPAGDTEMLYTVDE